MSVTPSLTEEVVVLVTNHIKANIAAELGNVRSRYSDNQVTIEVPQDYFYFENPHIFMPPAIFTIPVDLDFNLPKGANHISAKMRMNVAAVVEEKDKFNLSTKCWRYQVALHELLNNTRLTSDDNSLVLVIKVLHARFTPEYTPSGEKDNTSWAFRKEVHLECEIEHWENY